MILCVCCGKEITAEQRYRLIGGMAHSICVGYPGKDSQAGEPQTGDGCLRPAEQEQGNGE